jgi:hypothetical protein
VLLLFRNDVVWVGEADGVVSFLARGVDQGRVGVYEMELWIVEERTGRRDLGWNGGRRGRG